MTRHLNTPSLLCCLYRAFVCHSLTQHFDRYPQVSKRELLEWMNTTLNSSVANCDKDVGDGSAYAQIFHAINRKCVPIKQIKWEAKSEYDYTINFNLVQKALKNLKVDKAIPAEALMKGKPLDNIEFCQWLKHYYTHVATVEDYDGFAERENVAPGVSRKVKVSSSPEKPVCPGYSHARVQKFAAGDGSAPAKAPTKKAAGMSRPIGTRPMGGSANNSKAPPSTKASSAPSAQNVAQLKEAEATIAAQKEELSELNLNVDALTKEVIPCLSLFEKCFHLRCLDNLTSCLLA